MGNRLVEKVEKEKEKREEGSREEMEEEKRDFELSLQAKAFKEFEAGKNWKDLVKDEICTVSKARDLQKSWGRSEIDEEEVGDKLAKLREGVFEEERRVAGGSVNFPRRFRKMVSTEDYATRRGRSQLGKTYCYGCGKSIAFTDPNVPIDETIQNLKIIINYLLEKRNRIEENKSD